MSAPSVESRPSTWCTGAWRTDMPHIVIKLWPGHTEEEKRAAAEAVVRAAAEQLHAEPGWFSVGIEEVSPQRWEEEVFRPEILEKRDSLYALCDELK